MPLLFIRVAFDEQTTQERKKKLGGGFDSLGGGVFSSRQ
jgi:hypothetical protein